MNSPYQQTVDYLYQNLPMFQRVGAIAFKKDLGNTLALCAALGNPQLKFKSVHVAGTNGKGSSSHMLACILQTAGFKTGLYTSPHLKEFTERIKINGKEVAQQFVVDFVNRIKPHIETIKPSFFEITVAMAFEYFAQQKVDIAVIEVGLGGRLDSTNVITSEVSLITNIGWDHMDLLGDTLPKIALEKAGIIKKNIPVVISETQVAVESVFTVKANEESSPIIFADQQYAVSIEQDGSFKVNGKSFQDQIHLDLQGIYQQKNLAGVLATIDVLRTKGFAIQQEHIKEGLAKATAITGLKGRWQKLSDKPLIICDTGHNEDGIREVAKQISTQTFDRLFMIIGMVKDKDVSKVLKQLPVNAYYFFCQATIPRAMDAEELQHNASEFGLKGEVIRSVNEALAEAKRRAKDTDMIFIGASTFVVAEINEL